MPGGNALDAEAPATVRGPAVRDSRGELRGVDGEVTDFLKRLGVDFRVLLDPGQRAARAWRVRLLPVSFLVGADGRVRYSVIGEFDWASDDAAETVRSLLR